MQLLFWTTLLLYGAIVRGVAAEPVPIADLRRMTPPAEGITVTAEGTVLLLKSETELGYVLHDGNEGLFVCYPPEGIEWLPENMFLYSVTGLLVPGEFGPKLEVHHSDRLGKGAYPDAIEIVHGDFLSGRLDSQFVTVTGIVQQCLKRELPHGTEVEAEIMSGQGRVTVVIEGSLLPKMGMKVDDLVTITGVAQTDLGVSGQSANAYVRMPPDTSLFKLMGRPEVAPFEREVTAISDLQRFTPELGPKHRVHIEGQILARIRDGVCAVRDRSGAVLVSGEENDMPFAHGAWMSAVGFSTPGGLYGRGLKPQLLRSVWKPLPSKIAPAPPIPVTQIADLARYEHDLVTIDAIVEGAGRENWNGELRLRKEGEPFVAHLIRGGESDKMLEPGARVRVTGIVDLRVLSPNSADRDRQMDIRLWVPSEDDIMLLETAPMPPIHRQARGMIAFAALLALGAAWFWARSNHAIRKEKARIAMERAITGERSRIHLDLHDTLGHGLTAAAVRISAAIRRLDEQSPDRAGVHLEEAHRLIGESLGEARSLVAGAKPSGLTHGELLGSIQQDSAQITEGAEIEFISIGSDVEITGIPIHLETQIFLVAREAVTNAVRHSGGTRIEIDLSEEGDQILLAISDNGRGIRETSGSGLATIRARVSLVGGEFDLTNLPSGGTRVETRWPMRER